MGSIFETLREICETDGPSDEIVDHPIDFSINPVPVIRQDYTPVHLVRMGWVNERGTGGKSRKAVIHARSDRSVRGLEKGQLFCGYKSRARYGGDFYSIDGDITCPKCRKAVHGLDRSMILSGHDGWLY